MKHIFNVYFFVKQDVKSPGTEDVCACIKNKSGNEVDRIDVFES